MNSLPIRTKALTLGLAASVIGAAVAGCGASQPSPNQHAGKAKVTTVVSPTITLSNDADGPVNVQVAIDRTALQGGSTALAEQYAAAAEAAAALTVDRGGMVTICAFGSVGVRPVPVFRATLPPLSQEGQVVRGPDEAAWQAEIASAVDVAVGLAKPNATTTAELDALTAEPGSDVARALAYQLETQPTNTNVPNMIEMLTSGLVREHMLKLLAGISSAKPDTAAMAALIDHEVDIQRGTTPVATLVRLGPIGVTASNSLGPILTKRLITSWKLALQALPIDRGQVGSTL